MVYFFDDFSNRYCLCFYHLWLLVLLFDFSINNTKYMNNAEILALTRDIVILQNDPRLEFNGKTLVLTKMQYRCLWFMAKNRGMVLTREMIIDRVWSCDYINERSIDVCIGALNKRLGDFIGERIIKTIRGFGYMLPKEL